MELWRKLGVERLDRAPALSHLRELAVLQLRGAMSSSDSTSRPEPPDDRELVRRVIDGDRDAWEAMYAAYEPTVRFAVIRALGRYDVPPRDHLVADLRSEVFLRLVADDCRRLRRYRGRCSFRQWIKVVAGNFTIDTLRARKPSVALVRRGASEAADPTTLDIESLVDERPSPEEIVDERRRREALGGLVMRLNDEDRLFIELYYVEGHSYERVATLMGTTLGAVYARKNRIRKRLTRLARDAAIL